MTKTALHAAGRAIQNWNANRLTTFTPTNILQDFGRDILNALETVALIDELRSDEADTVTINADNAGFVGPGAIVECNGMWTDWQDVMFSGDNMLEALRAASAARCEKEKNVVDFAAAVRANPPTGKQE